MTRKLMLGALGAVLATTTLMGLGNDGVHARPMTATGSAQEDQGARTPGDDEITGTAGADRLRGGAGDDVITGLGGHDSISGDGGDDVLQGGGGKDRLLGGPGNDELRGGPGADTDADDGPGEDLVVLGPGDDSMWISTVDGERDVIRCGLGDDFVGYWGTPDPADVLTGCETVSNIAH